MRKIQNKKGFTLIELLVVITIIGILATGATATFTAQIQRARDSTRITDVTALKSGIEQLYQEINRYPDANLDNEGDLNSNIARRAFSSVKTYVETFPKDPKTGESCNGGTPCDYLYSVDEDDNTIQAQYYVVSTAFENQGNVNARGNSGDDSNNLRLELGTGLVGTAPVDVFDASEGKTLNVDSCSSAGVGTPVKNNPADYMLIAGDCPTAP